MNARSEHEATAEFAARVRLNRPVGNVDQREYVAKKTNPHAMAICQFGRLRIRNALPG